MSRLTITPVILFLCIVHTSAYPQPPALSDAELDSISAGWDFCPMFGITGPCVASALQIYEPFAAPISMQTAVPLPFNGTVSLTHESSISNSLYSQFASQTNTATQLPNPQVLFDKGTDLSATSLLMRTTPGFRP